jgi:hypothetical protein
VVKLLNFLFFIFSPLYIDDLTAQETLELQIVIAVGFVINQLVPSILFFLLKWRVCASLCVCVFFKKVSVKVHST